MGREHPEFSPMYYGQAAAWMNMPLDTDIGLGPGHVVLHGKPSLQERGTAAPNFRPISCGQTAGWITMPLGMVVGLVPGHIVLDGDPPPKGAQPPIFGPRLLWPNDWMG